MAKYDTQEVCLNGHQTTDKYYSHLETRKNFCVSCGAKTIHSCPACGKDIQGALRSEGVIIYSPTPIPSTCGNCGADFPWRHKNNAEGKLSPGPDKDASSLVLLICERFHLVAKQLCQRHAQRKTITIADEYDAQDLLHALLKIYVDDIRAEEWNPSYAGSSKRSDFLLKQEKIIIEVKKTRPSLKARQIGEELIIDIANYRNHPDCKTLICFVYDPDGHIANPKGIENDLSKKTDSFSVIVKIVPKGH